MLRLRPGYDDRTTLSGKCCELRLQMAIQETQQCKRQAERLKPLCNRGEAGDRRRERERESERERDRGRGTANAPDRKTEKEREREGQREKQKQNVTEIEKSFHVHIPLHIQCDSYTHQYTIYCLQPTVYDA